MKLPSVDLEISPIDSRTLHDARLTVAEYAETPDEACEFLEALGIGARVEVLTA